MKGRGGNFPPSAKAKAEPVPVLMLYRRKKLSFFKVSHI